MPPQYLSLNISVIHSVPNNPSYAPGGVCPSSFVFLITSENIAFDIISVLAYLCYIRYKCVYIDQLWRPGFWRSNVCLPSLSLED